MLKQKLWELESVSKIPVAPESIVDIGNIGILDFVDAGPKSGIVAVEMEIEISDDRTGHASSEDLMDWIESLTEDEIDGLADPYGYNLAEAEEW